MKLIKRVHSVVENADLEKHRHSQDYFGALLGASKDMDIRSVDAEGMHCEWICVNRVHMKKQVILYCHGGGYSTGSCISVSYTHLAISLRPIQYLEEVLSF